MCHYETARSLTPVVAQLCSLLAFSDRTCTVCDIAYDLTTIKKFSFSCALQKWECFVFKPKHRQKLSFSEQIALNTSYKIDQ